MQNQLQPALSYLLCPILDYTILSTKVQHKVQSHDPADSVHRLFNFNPLPNRCPCFAKAFYSNCKHQSILQVSMVEFVRCRSHLHPPRGSATPAVGTGDSASGNQHMRALTLIPSSPAVLPQIQRSLPRSGPKWTS